MGWPEMAASAQDVCLRAFADEETPGEPGFTYEPSGLAALDIPGLWNEAAELVPLDATEQPHSTTLPLLVVRRVHLPQDPIPMEDFVTRKKTGVRYEVYDARPDGEGDVALFLSEDPEGP